MYSFSDNKKRNKRADYLWYYFYLSIYEIILIRTLIIFLFYIFSNNIFIFKNKKNTSKYENADDANDYFTNIWYGIMTSRCNKTKFTTFLIYHIFCACMLCLKLIISIVLERLLKNLFPRQTSRTFFTCTIGYYWTWNASLKCH